MTDFDLRIISLGAGVQSATLLRMAALGEIPGPKPTHAIFADTQTEPSWVYEQLDSLERDHGDEIKIIRATVGNLAEDWFNGQKSARGENAMGAAIPLHLRMPDGSKGMALRSCTQRYKLTPILRATRELLGLKPGERVAGRFTVESWIGISLDEAAMRVKPSMESWITNRYPLAFDVPMTRGDCLEWLKTRGFPIAKRSACWHCPYKSNAEWRMLKEHPEEWAKAVDFDERLRSEKRFISSFGSEKGNLRGTPFLHSSRVPLAEANLHDVSERQLDLFQADCLGMCGV